ncbi:hypothetical protein SAY87_009694 [Trapa incisa]|uniref:Uncharacterized protein n=1 Tax=Trapa incisa TaxID=236973 RepID=A0AAN7JZ70_9MYRT|nr:hypothetical protein SAY87_009694 [Trapa incisa]
MDKFWQRSFFLKERPLLVVKSITSLRRRGREIRGGMVWSRRGMSALKLENGTKMHPPPGQRQTHMKSSSGPAPTLTAVARGFPATPRLRPIYLTDKVLNFFVGLHKNN